MDSSSDGDFAWTDASDDSTEQEMTKTNLNMSQSGEESESGKSYKKKLQQQLFAAANNDETTQNDAAPQQRKRHHSNAESVESSRKKQIKTEPEGDVNKCKVKKKHNTSEENCHSTNNAYDESFLEFKVKNEQSFAVPSPVHIKKKKRKSVSHSLSDNETSYTNGDIVDSQKSPSCIQRDGINNYPNHIEEDTSLAEYDANNCDTNSTRKKKSKKKHTEGEDNVEDHKIKESFSSNETIVEEHIESQNNVLHSEPSHTTGVAADVHSDRTNGHENMLRNKTIQQDTSLPINVADRAAKRKTRMSERITFEDEDSDLQSKSSKTSSKTIKKNKTSKLDSFIESSLHVRPVCTQLPGAMVLTGEDDLWVIRCPKEVEIEHFQDKKWTLDHKCKIKLNGQAYEGDLDDKKGNMTILSASDGKTIIKSITINGCIRLRRRLPKTHIQEDHVMVNNQSNFIPLPETKCRHPLFGFHYKKAIKVRPAVAERLRAAAAPTAPARDASPPPDNKKKKKKKKKHSAPADDDGAPRPKRRRRDAPPPEAWDSEQAIEDNLFNF